MIITGSSANDTLIGTAEADEIDGKLGNDRLEGSLGNDSLEGGIGNDTLLGGDGNDVFADFFASDEFVSAFDQHGDDSLEGGAGDDTLTDSAGNNTLLGGSGADRFLTWSGLGSNVATGGTEPDTYEAFRFISSDNNFVVTDFATGARGDRLDLDPVLRESAEQGFYATGNPFSPSLGFLRLFAPGSDTLVQWDQDGAAGGAHDWITLLTLQDREPSSLTVANVVGAIPPDGSSVAGVNRAGGLLNDTLAGTFFDDTISGLEGDDALDGSGGNDILDGGTGNDELTGGYGNDWLDGWDGDDLFTTRGRPTMWPTASPRAEARASTR